MNAFPFSRFSRFNVKVGASLMLGGLLLASCGSPQPNSTSGASSEMAMEAPAADGAAGMPQDNVVQAQANAAPTVPRSQPQLVKTAELGLVVDSVAESIEAITAIARQQQGDLLNLQDQVPQSEVARHTASIQIRVPQDRLEATLTALAELGTVQRQTITAEDVSNQLVDFQARLRNLRKSEELLLEIMERSGNVGDVLKVAQELNNIRSNIEQIDAQLQTLQASVNYSTIRLNLEEAGSLIPPQRSVQLQLQESWEEASHSVGKFTVDLLQLGIWLMAYSPYLLLFAGAATLAYLRTKQTPSSETAPPSNDPSASA